MNIIILGPQGSGKTTQAKLLANYLNITHISTGNLLRQIAKNKNHKLHKLVKKQLDSGSLVSNAIVNKVLNSAVEKALKTGGFIVDGTPRKIDQLTNLDELLSLYNEKVHLAIFIDTSIEESKNRLLKRAHIEHRSDDTKEAIEKRLNIYHKETEPVLKIYNDRGILVRVDGNRAIEPIQKDIQKIVKQRQPQ